MFISKINPAGTALVYSTFLGGGGFEFGRAIAVDAAGNAYVTGQTQGSGFPTTGGAFDTTFNIDNCPRCGIDQWDAFVTKLNAAGSGLVYSTFLGGFDFDDGRSIAVDGAGSAYVIGQTNSNNFPVRAGGFDTTYNGSGDTFVTKLNATGSALVYSTYIGGTQVELPEAVTVDGAGNAYVVGSTSSADYPTTAGAFDTTPNGGFDTFATKVNPSGSALVYSTLLGGTDSDSGSDVAVDAGGNAYVVGGTSSPEFPTTAGAFDTTFAVSDGFVVKLNPSGSALVYSTLVGGSGSDFISSIALTLGGNAWLAGGSGSVDFPTTTAGGFETTFNGGVSDALVAELNAAGSDLLVATLIGGTNSEGAVGHRPRRRRVTWSSPAAPSPRTSLPPPARSIGCSTAISSSSGAMRSC